MLEYSPPDAERRIQQVLAFMVEHILEGFDLEAAAAAASESKFYLIRLFRQVTGDTPGVFFRKLKIIHIDKYLQEHPDISLTDLAYRYGYSSSGVLSREYRRFMGVLPKVCRAEFQKDRSNILQIPDNILRAFQNEAGVPSAQ